MTFISARKTIWREFLPGRGLRRQMIETRVKVKKVIIAVLFSLVLALPQAYGAEGLKKIRIASKAAGESLVPYKISQRLGF